MMVLISAGSSSYQYKISSLSLSLTKLIYQVGQSRGSRSRSGASVDIQVKGQNLSGFDCDTVEPADLL